MTENTRDLSRFGIIELEEAARLLAHVKEIDSGDGLTLEFNPVSGNVFLVDNDFRVWLFDHDGEINEFFCCFECGHEGFKPEFKGRRCKQCKQIYKEVEP